MSAALAYGLREGRVLHAGAVEPGLACGCVCPACGARLRARRGKVRLHFVHDGTPACTAAVPESHRLAAVQAFAELRRLRLPPLERISFAGDDAVAARRPTEREQAFEAVDPGGALGSHPVDAVGTVRGRRLAVVFRAALPQGPAAALAARGTATALLEVDVRDAATVGPGAFPAWATLSAPRRWLWHPWDDAVAVEATLLGLGATQSLDHGPSRAIVLPVQGLGEP